MCGIGGVVVDDEDGSRCESDKGAFDRHPNDVSVEKLEKRSERYGSVSIKLVEEDVAFLEVSIPPLRTFGQGSAEQIGPGQLVNKAGLAGARRAGDDEDLLGFSVVQEF